MEQLLLRVLFLSSVSATAAVEASAALSDSAALVQQRAAVEGGKPKLEILYTCGGIRSAWKCAHSFEWYGLNCTGWGGSSCLDAAGVCSDISDPSICNSARKNLSMLNCAGWGGSSCLSEGADPRKITDKKICENAAVMLRGIRGAEGWGGAECLSWKTKTCKNIKTEDICKQAKAKFGLNCLGWGGSHCIRRGETDCRQITTPRICHEAPKTLGMPCVWNAQMHRCYGL
eukprot:CAMPEP_0204573060 /NCGR_PEP_ID=MMETSP0661-20131031/39800_1 /ASSEMBLY_ACC=CAM_ASM_000606 /TAXON_ID=109239 /ORGANISM="Alexandrium margalefi, Strain AMGDE01CS-322" /LENGTH=229 /DNA_ID=CAMNT_0051581447 /DNA_START=98 /DNA_END=787 /DNA_ORIENTATION=+